MDESLTSRVSAVAALDEPTRRRLYDYVARQETPVSRDTAAEALGLSRSTVVFHLDRLVGQGLLETVAERRTGGPGAGRPSKLYRRAPQQIAVSLPDRRYELAGHLLATAVHQADGTGRSPRPILDRLARELGRDIGRASRDAHPGAGGHASVMRALEDFGFEPRVTRSAPDATIVLGNCPFHTLAQQHTELVCGMNLCLLNGLLDGLDASGVTARLDPAPDRCCVRLQPDPPTSAP
ncbi:helix-turn-helix transcriptional regulator [Thermomonospora umbrina]|uniref:Putative ArsR family transcriptional regulator n=1 Tax=Thermomonospora umbrina TaxID=111806 RepID=A0A3D9SXZ2_9ACTN|nr:helix-turn-helix domain-containing protein [Thermomonospora umbrina]REE99370.1 putative ArsR family transcriptional regulator [Thermomonospora umbrina]